MAQARCPMTFASDRLRQATIEAIQAVRRCSVSHAQYFAAMSKPDTRIFWQEKTLYYWSLLTYWKKSEYILQSFQYYTR